MPGETQSLLASRYSARRSVYFHRFTEEKAIRSYMVDPDLSERYLDQATRALCRRSIYLHQYREFFFIASTISTKHNRSTGWPLLLHEKLSIRTPRLPPCNTSDWRGRRCSKPIRRSTILTRPGRFLMKQGILPVL